VTVIALSRCWFGSWTPLDSRKASVSMDLAVEFSVH
jgi:hypothetical protein